MSHPRIRRAMALAVTLLSVLLSLPGLASAQGTLADYQRASTVMDRFDDLTVGLVDGPNWIDETNRFWYRVTVTGGARFVVVDPEGPARAPAFDHERLASALSTATGESYTAITLPFRDLEFVRGGDAIEVEANDARFRCTLSAYECAGIGEEDDPDRSDGPGGGSDRDVVVSPDGTLEAFIRDHNVAVRPVSGDDDGRPGAGAQPEHTLLSRDGSAGDAYQLRSIRWSPDSGKLVVYRQRPGYTREVPYIRSSPRDQVQPILEINNYRKPGDVLDFNQPVLFDVETGSRTVIDTSLFPDPYQISRAEWREDGRAYTFEYNERGHQVYRVLEVDAGTGAVRTVIDETSPTFVSYRSARPGLRDTGHIWRHDIDDGREILWMSQRDGWSHLYLYDGETGRVKNQVTKGDWVVRYVDSVDVANRQIHFRGLGMNPDQDPYFVHFYRIDFDGTNLVEYTQGDGSHEIDWSPDRRYYVDTYSRVDMPPVVELHRASDGRSILELERGDMSAALATGWTPPEVFVAKGRDGETDIWGIIVRPFTFDESREYPVIEQIYAGPQGSFVPKTWGGGQGLVRTAELGFVLVQIDGMGTNNRSKAFHDVAWQNLKDAGFPDRILWHKAAAEKYPWYDDSRVGLYGGSAGGQNAAGGVFLHGDFYHAAFASSGCHDNRMDKIWWNEQWMGKMGSHYEASSNVTHAHNLTGRLFLAVGEMDTNVDPASTMQVVDALIRAGKSFELLVVPNGGHGATGRNGTRKRNDFFVEALLGVDPPDWNRLEADGERADVDGMGDTESGQDDAPFGFFLDDELPPTDGFFVDPVDGDDPYRWW